MAELSIVEAINDAFHVELERDPSVMVMGEDVGRAGGVFRATAGLRDRFGADRCVDTPLAEAGLLGGAVGLCMAGWRPVVEMQYDAFSYPCLDQLITHVGRYRWRSGGGPTLIEAVHYRAAPHATADDPRAYIDLDRVEEERAHECVGRYEEVLRSAGALTDEHVESVRREAEELMRAGITAAEAEPPADPDLLFRNVYVDPPENLRRG